jgi:hypothetical protein
VQRPTMKFVATKTAFDQVLISSHRKLLPSEARR